MAVTLAQAKESVQDKLSPLVIDEFRKSGFLLDHIPFDDCVACPGGGSTMTYSYTRVVTQPTAQFRELNSEYTPQEAAKKRYSVDLKIFGGSFQIDRVIADMGGAANEVGFQMAQKVKAAAALFTDTEKALTGSSTELIPAAAIDLSTSAAVDTNYMYFLDALDEFLMGLDGTPDFIGGNTKLIAKLRACARRAGMYQASLNEFGQQVERYGSIPLVDLGAKPGTNDPIVPVDSSENVGCTSLYAVRFGLDGFHAVSPAGMLPVRQWLPDYRTSGAVKTGEVEMVAAVALKSTKAAGVMRKIKVSA